ncbi:MAG TPA: VOC family protein [Conexibacter sp.]|jgi:catechol 2,3-dioxygenase-like lactoylglutathione lyase family enzyme|nr:VOC family protein [Conexibacter sp.]
MTRRVRLGHVGLCVADIDAAVAWYRDVLGLELLDGPRDLRADADSRAAEVLGDVFGPAFRCARIAQLGCEGDVGIELFEFAEPRGRRDVAASYFQHGVSHVCFQAEDLEGMVERIRAGGGRIRTAVWRERPGRPYRFVHFEDPFGNLLELHAHGNREQVLGASAPAP